MLDLPKDYDFVKPGYETLRHGLPWLVPGAMRVLDKTLNAEMRVLEIGSGGSTIFFSRRTKKVKALETNKTYLDKVSEHIKDVQNVQLYHVGLHDLLAHLRSVDERYDVISIDHEGSPPNRSQCLQSVMTQWAGGILVLDNWGKRKAWPGYHDLSAQRLLSRLNLTDHVVMDFRHEEWAGLGTRLVLRKDLV